MSTEDLAFGFCVLITKSGVLLKLLSVLHEVFGVNLTGFGVFLLWDQDQAG